jgi:hypothetical protein
MTYLFCVWKEMHELLIQQAVSYLFAQLRHVSFSLLVSALQPMAFVQGSVKRKSNFHRLYCLAFENET